MKALGLTLIALCVFLAAATAEGFGGSPPKAPPPAEPVPVKTDTDVSKARGEAAMRARKRKGRAATILGGETAPDDAVQRSEKDLLGA